MRTKAAPRKKAVPKVRARIGFRRLTPSSCNQPTRTGTTEEKQAAEALRESQEQYRLIFDTMLQGVVCQDSNGTVISMNRSAERILGKSPDQMLGNASFVGGHDVIREDGSPYPRSEHPSKVALRTGKPAVGIMGVFNPVERQYRWINLQAVPLFRNGEAVAYQVFNIFDDITDRRRAEEILRINEHRKHAEEKLRQSEQTFSAIFYNNAAAMTLTYLEDGRVIDANSAWLNLLRLDREQVIGLTASEYHGWKNMADRDEIVRELKQTGSVHNREYQGVRADGEEFTFLFSAQVLSIHGEQLLISSGIDITARKKAEAALRDALTKAEYGDRLLETLMNNVPDGITIADAPDANIRMVSQHGQELLGAPHAGKTAFTVAAEWRIFHPDGVTPMAPEDLPLMRALRGETVTNVELVQINAAGRRLALLCNAAPICDAAGKPVSAIVVWRDITELRRRDDEVHLLNSQLARRAAELEATNRELESFAYSISHDLRAPLRGIDGFSRILLRDAADKLDDSDRDSLQRIRTNTLRMGQLIDDLLHLSRITRERMQCAPVNLSELAEAVSETLRRNNPERTVTFSITPDLVAHGDRRLLQIVLENLLGNALKFTAGQPSAQIEFGMDNDAGGRAYFVRDNGAGFDMHYADKLFTPFQRLHTTEEFPGTGIGLATVRRVIHRHGGRVWAQGRQGCGATFRFTLPETPGDHE